MRIGNTTQLKSHEDAVAENKVPGESSRFVKGYNAIVPVTLQDVCELGANVPRPVTALAMTVVSTNAADVGVLIYTSTATGGSTTTLEDTAQDFTAGNVVQVGDIILLDDLGRTGIVTGVAATILTVIDGFGGVTPSLGGNYRIVDVSAGGTGIQVVDSVTLDTNFVQQNEYTVMNAAIPVALTKTVRRVNFFHSMMTGTNEVGVGDITMNNAGTSYTIIKAGGNNSLQCHFTVPAGKKALVRTWGCSASANKDCRVLLRATRDPESLELVKPFNFIDLYLTQAAGSPRPFRNPQVIPAKADIKVSAQELGGGGGGIVEADFDFEVINA